MITFIDFQLRTRNFFPVWIYFFESHILLGYRLLIDDFARYSFVCSKILGTNLNFLS